MQSKHGWWHHTLRLCCSQTELMASCIVLLMVMVSGASAQLQTRWLATTSNTTSMGGATVRGWVSAGLPAASRVEHAGYGWVGLYPVAQNVSVMSVLDLRSNCVVWPQPASAYLRVKGLQGKLLERGLPLRSVQLTDVFGRSVHLPCEWEADDVVTIDVRKLSPGTYALGHGSGVVVRIGSLP